MPYWGINKTGDYYRKLSKRRNAYKKKLIVKGVMGGSNKMSKLMIRKGL